MTTKGVLLILSIILFASVAHGSGLGDFVDKVKNEHREIVVQDYDYFGNPPRAGALQFNAKGLFGASPNTNPEESQFFSGVKKLIPSDAKLTATYVQKGRWQKEIYEFKSASLTKVPNIKEAAKYQKDLWGHPVGTFFIIVDYDIDHKDRVACCIIVLGLPGEADLSGKRKISKNPFKSAK